MVAILYLLASTLLGLFTTNPEIIALGTTVMGLALICETGRLLNFIVGFSIKTTGNPQFIAVFGISAMWLFSVPLTWFLGIYLGYGLVGIWLAMGIDEVFRGSVALFYWNRRQRLHNKAIAEGTLSPIKAAQAVSQLRTA